MQITLPQDEKSTLEQRHKTERDGRIRDRIKVVLLKSEGWTVDAIAQAVRVHPETVGAHLRKWCKEQKLKPQNGGSSAKLTAEQASDLDTHLQQNCYDKVSAICQYVSNQYAVTYTVSGMTKWLKAHGFTYKQPKLVPSKMNPDEQAEFINKYQALCKKCSSEEVIVFMDAVHPTMATKLSHGWIKKGSHKWLKQTASRTHVNVIGAIELSQQTVQSSIVKTVNTETILEFLQKVKSTYSQASKIHIILDQAGYHRSLKFKKQAKSIGLELHYLPPYSPNLNPIERLWKVMNEHCRNNVVFDHATDFRSAIENFFENTVHEIKETLNSRINDNFQVLKTASSC